MSLLHNNTKALELVCSLSVEELAARFGPREPVAGRVAAAIRNSDTERRKECLLRLNPAGIVAGLKVLTLLTGAEGAVIVTPAEGVETALLAAADQAGLPLTFERRADLVTFDHRDDLLVSLEDAASMAAALCGETAGVLAAVDDGELEELPPETGALDFVKAHTEAAIKAVLTDHRFYAPAELETLSLGELGSKSGVLTVLDEKTCLVDRAKQELRLLREKSCGRCTFCREGLFQLSTIAEELSTGRLKPQALELAGEIADAMGVSTCCSLGEDGGAPMASLLRSFPRETEAHARRKECPAGVCAAFSTFYIDPEKCTGSRACVRACPANAIEGKPGYTSVIESFDCTRCGACLTACAQNAIVKVMGRNARIPDKPLRLKNAAADEETPAAAPARREGAGKRKRTFAKPNKS